MNTTIMEMVALKDWLTKYANLQNYHKDMGSVCYKCSFDNTQLALTIYIGETNCYQVLSVKEDGTTTPKGDYINFTSLRELFSIHSDLETDDENNVKPLWKVGEVSW